MLELSHPYTQLWKSGHHLCHCVSSHEQTSRAGHWPSYLSPRTYARVPSCTPIRCTWRWRWKHTSTTKASLMSTCQWVLTVTLLSCCLLTQYVELSHLIISINIGPCGTTLEILENLLLWLVLLISQLLLLN